jgi:V/A-type H+-transporting ATPase subunit K
LKRSILSIVAVALVLSIAAPAASFAYTGNTAVATQGNGDGTMQAEHDAAGDTGRNGAVGYGLAALAAAFAVGLCALGTGYAQAKIGTAGGGALAEKPELAGVMIILVAIPETAVILGFVIAISLLGKL